MNITVNGEKIQIQENATIMDLLESYDLHPESIAVEINFEIIPRFKFNETALKENDQVEMVHFVGGG